MAGRANMRHRVEARRASAQVRAEDRKRRTNRDQLERLDAAGHDATRERKRLNKESADESLGTFNEQAKVLVEGGHAKSMSEARRLVDQGWTPDKRKKKKS